MQCFAMLRPLGKVLGSHPEVSLYTPVHTGTCNPGWLWWGWGGDGGLWREDPVGGAGFSHSHG